MISPAIGFIIEGADDQSPKATITSSKDNDLQGLKVIDSIPTNVLEGVFDLSGKDNDYLYYKDEVMTKENLQEYLCTDSPRGPLSVSFCYSTLDNTYIAIIRTIEGNQRISIPASSIVSAWWRRLLRLSPSTSEILYSIDPSLPINKLKRIVDPRLPTALLSMEEQQHIKGFKFGLVYAKEGQTKEDEMFSNVETSDAFEEFLSFIGDKITLSDWKGFRGGLDVKSGTTGKEAIYKNFNNNDIIYHVSTLLPYNAKDKQQLERKRHIGNDIIVVVFQEGDTVYKPTTISSRQVHVVFVVKPVTIDDERYYRLAVVYREGVPEFGPALPKDALFRKDELFLQLFYAKLLNAERACYRAPILHNKLTRTRTAILRDLAQNFT